MLKTLPEHKEHCRNRILYPFTSVTTGPIHHTVFWVFLSASSPDNNIHDKRQGDGSVYTTSLKILIRIPTTYIKAWLSQSASVNPTLEEKKKENSRDLLARQSSQ